MRKTALLAVAILAACAEGQSTAPIYDSAAVERASISVSVVSSGVVEPLAIVEVKSKASGEVLELFVETGDYVEQGELLVRIDPRTGEQSAGAGGGGFQGCEVTAADIRLADGARRAPRQKRHGHRG